MREVHHRALLAFAVIVMGIVGSVFVGCAEDVSDSARVDRIESPVNFELPRPMKPWTLLFYNAADFQGYNPTEDVARLMQSTGGVHVVMLEDLPDGEATVWYLGGNARAPRLIALEQWGEIDMGDGLIFSSILQFCAANFPSQRTLVMLYQHGRGWQGACYDAHPSAIEGEVQTSYLTPGEMRDALHSVGGIDALLFTAPCIMGALETVYQLREMTDLYIGSEAVSGFMIWQGALPTLLEALTRQPDIPVVELGRYVLELVQTTFSRDAVLANVPEHLHHLVSSAVLSSIPQSPAMESIVPTLDAFSLALLSAWEYEAEAILQVREQVQSFGYNEVVDAVDFARRCAFIPGIREEAEAFAEAVLNVVDSAFTDPERYPDAHGLSLYFPMPSERSTLTFEEHYTRFGYGQYREMYRNAGLDLVDSTHWPQFLSRFYETVRTSDGS